MKANLWVLFCLVSIQATIEILIGDMQIQTEVDSDQDGAGFNLPSFAPYIDIPRTNFMAQTWCFIDSMEVDDAPLMSLKTGPTTTFDLKLASGNFIASHNGEDYVRADATQKLNKWILLSIGSIRNRSFFRKRVL